MVVVVRCEFHKAEHDKVARERPVPGSLLSCSEEQEDERPWKRGCVICVIICSRCKLKNYLMDKAIA